MVRTMHMTPTEEQSFGALQTLPTHIGTDWSEPHGLVVEALATRLNPLTFLEPENYHKLLLWDSITIPGKCISHPESMT